MKRVSILLLVPLVLEPAATRSAPESAPRDLRPGERQRVFEWLDDGLRGGRRGRLEAEYPVSMAQGAHASHRVIFEAGRPLSHAMLHVASVEARGRSLRVGLVGNVYTATGARGRGLAGRCIESCVHEARRRGLPLVILWSDRDAFYRRLGFHECGVESYLALDSAAVGHALALAEPPARAFDVRPAEPSDFPQMERLYHAQPVHVRRAEGTLQRLAGAPDSRTVVAHRAGAAVAYASLGRGDDFQGVVHEWAGDAAGVLGCIEALAAGHDPLLLLAGPAGGKVIDALRGAGAPEQRVFFARARLLDAAALWKRIGCEAVHVSHDGRCVRFESPVGGSWRCELSEAETLRCLFGAASGKALAPLLEQVPESLVPALRAHLPWPLYVWGFDSI